MIEQDTPRPAPQPPPKPPAQAHKDALAAVGAALHREFTGPESADRRAQVDSHLATVAMVIDHLYDEAARALADT